ncbi:MAG: hypothetical protein FJ034_07060 [Chloroflexi bacterium]|nr:hypothetical protein [Chloroflexota bacterium]
MSADGPRPGDRIRHFAFGLCDVMIVREGRAKLLEVESRRLREVSLGALRLGAPAVEDGRRVFPATRPE